MRSRLLLLLLLLQIFQIKVHENDIHHEDPVFIYCTYVNAYRVALISPELFPVRYVCMYVCMDRSWQTVHMILIRKIAVFVLSGERERKNPLFLV